MYAKKIPQRALVTGACLIVLSLLGYAVHAHYACLGFLPPIIKLLHGENESNLYTAESVFVAQAV